MGHTYNERWLEILEAEPDANPRDIDIVKDNIDRCFGGWSREISPKGIEMMIIALDPDEEPDMSMIGYFDVDRLIKLGISQKSAKTFRAKKSLREYNSKEIHYSMVKLGKFVYIEPIHAGHPYGYDTRHRSEGEVEEAFRIISDVHWLKTKEDFDKRTWEVTEFAEARPRFPIFKSVEDALDFWDEILLEIDSEYPQRYLQLRRKYGREEVKENDQS